MTEVLAVMTVVHEEELRVDITQLVMKRLAAGDYVPETRNALVVEEDCEAYEIGPADLAEGGTLEQVVNRKRARGQMLPTTQRQRVAEDTETAE